MNGIDWDKRKELPKEVDQEKVKQNREKEKQRRKEKSQYEKKRKQKKFVHFLKSF